MKYFVDKMRQKTRSLKMENRKFSVFDFIVIGISILLFIANLILKFSEKTDFLDNWYMVLIPLSATIILIIPPHNLPQRILAIVLCLAAIYQIYYILYILPEIESSIKSYYLR
jgi:hypothetical protein